MNVFIVSMNHKKIIHCHYVLHSALFNVSELPRFGDPYSRLHTLGEGQIGLSKGRYEKPDHAPNQVNNQAK